MKTCSICIEEVHDALFIKCPMCVNEYCHSCFKEYVKTLKNEVKCMCCNTEWEQAFIYRNLPLHIVYTVLKSKRADILLEREKAQLPAAQLQMQRRNNILAVNKEIQELKDRLYVLREHQRNGYRTLSDDSNKVNPLVCGCPLDTCRGFITKPGYKCGICETAICRKCNVILGTVHECKEEDIKTVKVLKSDTKPCPGCGAASKKTDGCNQVWCIMCKKAWNWNTGKLENGAVHATDYLNFLRRNGQTVPRAAGDDRCPNANDSWRRFPRQFARYTLEMEKTQYDHIIKIYQRVAEYEYEGMRRGPVMDNADIAISYLENKIDEKKWTALIVKRDKQFTFDTEIATMKTAFFYGLCDIFSRFVLHPSLRTDIIKEILEFEKMMLSEYSKLANVFKSKRKAPFSVE